MSIISAENIKFCISVPVIIIGAGACGLSAALAAHDAGTELLVLERDAVPGGSTALSSGMIPACGTRLQKINNIDDSPAVMAADIQRKAGGKVDPVLLDAVCRACGPAIDWLADAHGLEFILVDGFLYPGHSRLRMHAPASKTGAELIGSLNNAAERAGIDVMTHARVSELFADPDGRIRGVQIKRPDGSQERIGCAALILACNGFGGNSQLVRQHIPEIADALYFGHPGNQGEAVLWGQVLGAALKHMGAYQGHGSVATPQGVLITWAIMMEGGIQVNNKGRRFANEQQGYSEQAVAVLAQPGGVAWDIFDQRLHELAMGFEDYRNARDLDAVKSAPTIVELAGLCHLPANALQNTIRYTQACAGGEKQDVYGRDFKTKQVLSAPYYAVKVTGALFHTQGGLCIDTQTRVLREDGSALPNLFAAGGAACGLSGDSVAGYLSGNGLLSAVVLGRIAGQAAAASCRGC